MSCYSQTDCNCILQNNCLSFLLSKFVHTETLNSISYLSKSKEDKLSLNAFGPRDKKHDLPMVDVIQAFAGIHCDDGVGIEAVSSLWWLPAVKESSHC